MSQRPEDPKPKDDGGLACHDLPEYYSALLELDAAFAAGERPRPSEAVPRDHAPGTDGDAAELDAQVDALAAPSLHLEGCAGCRDDFADFVAQTRRLQALEMPPASPRLIDGILAAVDASATTILSPQDMPRSGRGRSPDLRRVASHLVAALAGAAAVLAVTTRMNSGLETSGGEPHAPSSLVAAGPSGSNLDSGSRRNGIEGSAGVDHPFAASPSGAPDGIRVRFSGGSGDIVRDGQRERVAGSVTFYPGEEIEIATPEPMIVERIVPSPSVIHQRAPWMMLPPIEEVDVDQYAVALSHSLDTLRQSFGRVSQTWDDVAVPALSGAWREGLQAQLRRDHDRPTTIPPTMVATAAPTSGASPTATAQNAPTTRGTNAATMPTTSTHGTTTHATTKHGTATPNYAGGEPKITDRSPSSPAPVEVTVSGTGLRIQTRGPLSEVVPILIVLLKKNPEVRHLVADRLQLIRTDLEQDDTLRAAFEASDRALETRSSASLIGRILPRSEPDPPGLVERWTHWWESNAIHLVARGANGTF